jgi:hypothetical protein
MITVHQAQILAIDEIRKIDSKGELIFEYLSEFEEGWFFYFNSKKFLETRNILDSVLGLGPVMVSKEKGIVFHAGSALSEEHWIKKFKEYIQK